MRYTANVIAMLSLYFLGMGGGDVSSFGIMLGVQGIQNWQSTFYQVSSYFNDTIIVATKIMLTTSLNNEVVATIKKNGG